MTDKDRDRELAELLHSYATRVNERLAINDVTRGVAAGTRADIVNFVARVRKLADEMLRLSVEFDKQNGQAVAEP